MSRYDIDLFDPAPDPDLVCCICKSVLDTPVESPCRHVFCRVCITTWLGTCPTCPTCRRSIVSTEPVMPLIQGIINRLKMKCVNHATGCTSTVTLEQYDAHVKDCAYQEVTCQFKNCGQVLLKGGLGQHETTCTFREVKCHKSCGLMITYVDRKKHDCVRALQQCVSDQQEALRQFREKENEWERMRQRLEKQVTKLSESIASSRRNSLTPWGMSLLSWLNLDSDHASGHDDNDYEEGSHDGNNDDYVLSEENVDNDGGYGTTNGVVNADSSDVMVLRSGSSVPVERGGGDGDVDEGWSRILPVPRLRSRSRFRSRDERQSRSETHDRSPLVSRDRSQSRSPTRPMWDTTSSRRRRFSRSRQARPLSRHLSRTRPDLTAIPGPDAHEESGNDRRSRRRARYYSRHDSDSDRSSASESNWSYRDEDLFLSDTYYSEHSSPYYTNGSYGARDYEDFPAEDTSHHESSSPVGIDTEEDTRTVVSISDSHISAEFSQQEDSDGEAERSLDNAPVNEHVSDDRISTGSLVAVDSRSAFDDSNGHADNAENVGHIFDDITGGSSDGSRYVDDLNNIGHLGELLETYLQSGVHTSKGSAPDGYTADVALSADTYQDRERPAGEIHSDPTAGHPTCSSEDTRETHEEGRPDFKNLIRDSDIMVSAEETVGGEHHAGQNKASSSLVEGIGATRKRRRHDDEGGDGVVSSRKKLKWHQPTDPWPSQDRWQADAVCDYYTHDYLNGTASSGSFRGFSRTDSRPSTVTNSAGPRAASDPQRRHKHPIRRHTSVGRISTLSSSSQPPTEARDRVTSQSGSANEGTTTGVHGRAASRTARPRHAASVSASARRDAADGAGSHRRYTVESTDVIATTRSGRRSSRRHRDLHTGRHDSRGGDQPTTRPVIARPPVDTLEGSDSNDTLWLPDNDGGDSSDHSQSTEPTSDSSYEVLVPKTWVQMLNEYDSEDSDRSWRP